jgi:hypothetical protein
LEAEDQLSRHFVELVALAVDQRLLERTEQRVNGFKVGIKGRHNINLISFQLTVNSTGTECGAIVAASGSTKACFPAAGSIFGASGLCRALKNCKLFAHLSSYVDVQVSPL